VTHTGTSSVAPSVLVVCVATHASGNDIGVDGATALASALERNSTLQHLRVSGEYRGDVGV
jgi:hypothetical protein